MSAVNRIWKCGNKRVLFGFSYTFLSFSFDQDLYFVMQISTKINESIKVMTLYLYDAAMCISRVVIEVAGRELQQN